MRPLTVRHLGIKCCFCWEQSYAEVLPVPSTASSFYSFKNISYNIYLPHLIPLGICGAWPTLFPGSYSISFPHPHLAQIHWLKKQVSGFSLSQRHLLTHLSHDYVLLVSSQRRLPPTKLHQCSLQGTRSCVLLICFELWVRFLFR